MAGCRAWKTLGKCGVRKIAFLLSDRRGVIVLTQEQIRKKLYASAEQFKDAYMAKQYARAKNIYDTAERVALFVDLPMDDRRKLFMSQNDSNDKDAKPIWGAFNQDMVRDAYMQCIKAGQTFEMKKYEDTVYGKKNP